MAGEIVHLELPSRNFERSAAFYGKLFGWRQDGAQSGGHLSFQTPRAAEGGTDEGATSAGPAVGGSWVLAALAQAPGPLPFVAVDDIAGTLAEAERLGGRILVPRLPLAGHGEFGLLADPDGNIIAVTLSKTVSGEPPRTAAAKAAGAPRSKESAPAKDGSGSAAGKAASAPRGGGAKAPAKAPPARKR